MTSLIDRGAAEKSSTKLKIEEVQSMAKVKRVAAHSHVKGLGLDPETHESVQSCGWIGQEDARRAAGVVVELVRRRHMAGRAVLLAGPPGTGKTAIALAIAKELGDKVPFCPMVASEVYSAEVKKTEVLMEHFRRAIGLRIREKKEVYEGEVVELAPVESDNGPLGGIGKQITHVQLTLKTVKGTKQLRLDPSIYDSLLKQRVEIGDVVYVEANTGIVKRVGRCDIYATEFDLEADEFVPLPKGDVHKTKEVVQDVTLHDLDVANSKPHGGGRGGDLMSVINQLSLNKKTEITERLRTEINRIVNEYIESGVAELQPGVLFIDEAHVLDADCFAFLHRALESSFSPVLVLATNRGHAKVRTSAEFGGGDGELSPHGIPRELLDRLLIILTTKYSRAHIRQIVAIRAEAEAVKLEDEALEKLAEIGESTSLRYVSQLLTPSKLLAAACGREKVSEADVKDVSQLLRPAAGGLAKMLTNFSGPSEKKPSATMETD